ncbi:hypothetical protein Tco_1017292 [Tanacetum coccineum]|uniref:Uncharacterized protein n=1 Tax=Tanacetum coccineum TaxID=301880 RepID=A0ABQ5FTN3_9ASTR
METASQTICDGVTSLKRQRHGFLDGVRTPHSAIPMSLPPQPIGEATKASNLRRIPPGVQGRSQFTYFLYLIFMSFLTTMYSPENIMDEINIDDLTIEQYFKLTQENHAPSVGIKVDDMTIAEYLEYEETIKTHDYDGYLTHSTKAGVSTRHRDHLSPRYKNPDPPLDAKTDPYFQASLSLIHPKSLKPIPNTQGRMKSSKNENRVMRV